MSQEQIDYMFQQTLQNALREVGGLPREDAVVTIIN